MIAASAVARSEDISNLFTAILVYIGEADPDDKVIPEISAHVKKSESRGFKHPVLARLLCPIKYLDKFKENPAEYCLDYLYYYPVLISSSRFMKRLDNGTVKVRSRDMPSFLWPRDGYDPDDTDANMFRNPALVMVHPVCLLFLAYNAF